MDGRKVVFERRYDDGEVAWVFRVDEARDADIVVTGKGNMPGAYAMIECLDEAVKKLGVDGNSKVYFDVSKVRGAPLKTQFLFGKWLLAHRKMIGRAAIVGAGPWERRLATAVCTIAGLRSFKFFEGHPEARSWLVGAVEGVPA